MTGDRPLVFNQTKQPSAYMIFSEREIEVIEEFVRRVNRRAERTILHTGMVSGVHFNAMKEELKMLKSE